MQKYTYRFHLKLKFPNVPMPKYVAEVIGAGAHVLFGTTGYMLIEAHRTDKDADSALKVVVSILKDRLGSSTKILCVDKMGNGLLEKRLTF